MASLQFDRPTRWLCEAERSRNHRLRDFVSAFGLTQRPGGGSAQPTLVILRPRQRIAGSRNVRRIRRAVWTLRYFDSLRSLSTALRLYWFRLAMLAQAEPRGMTKGRRAQGRAELDVQVHRARVAADNARGCGNGAPHLASDRGVRRIGCEIDVAPGCRTKDAGLVSGLVRASAAQLRRPIRAQHDQAEAPV